MSPPSPSPSLEVAVTSPTIPSSFTPPVPISVHISIRNNADTSVTVLKWGTPLDPRANVLGVLEIRDTETGEPVPLDIIKIARKLPASEDDLVQIGAGESVEAVVKLPRVPLLQGRQYLIQAKGRWHGVWEQPIEEVAAQHLDTLSGAQRGEFASPTITIQMVE